MLPLAAVNPFELFHQSDIAGQLIVMVLCLMSLLAWTTMIGKYLQLRRFQNTNARFSATLANAGSVVEAPTRDFANCPYAEMTSSAVSALGRAQSITEDVGSQMGHVENAIQRTLNSVSLKYESKLIFLGSMVSGAPFLGLLGTVWGVMIAFGGISTQSGPVTIQTLAPGVASALLTTVTGLLVAIPAVFGYNYLLTQAKSMVSELENFSSALADRIELENMPALGANALETPQQTSFKVSPLNA